MSIVQIYDQTAPFVSGYSMRSLYITESLHKLGLPLKVVSSPIFTYKKSREMHKGVEYFHPLVGGWNLIKHIPLVKESFIVQAIQKEVQRNCSEDIKTILVSTARRFLMDRPAVSH